MPSFLASSKLTKGDIRLFLTNQDGYPQDASKVRWTVYSIDGTQISGKQLCAIKASTGEYYAPWQTSNKTGNYYVKWEWIDESGDPTTSTTENFFVINLSSYGPNCPITADGYPVPGGFTYLNGSLLGPGDLPLYTTDADGLPVDPYAVFWTVFNAIGAPMTTKAIAARAAVGEYYAPWFVNAISGDYTITWEYMEQIDSPIEAKTMRFSVINPGSPYAPLAPVECPCTCWTEQISCQSIISPSVLTPCVSPCPSPVQLCGAGAACAPSCPTVIISPPCPAPTDRCCPFEIPRVVHLNTGTLPISGAWTNQVIYKIPERTRCITFYITYRRGAPGGYPQFKLMWGNGVEETQETMIDLNYEVLSPSTSVQSMYLQDLTGPIPETDNFVNSTLHVGIPGGATTVRLLASEKGQPAIPGTAGITLTAAG